MFDVAPHANNNGTASLGFEEDRKTQVPDLYVRGTKEQLPNYENKKQREKLKQAAETLFKSVGYRRGSSVDRMIYADWDEGRHMASVAEMKGKVFIVRVCVCVCVCVVVGLV